MLGKLRPSWVPLLSVTQFSKCFPLCSLLLPPPKHQDREQWGVTFRAERALLALEGLSGQAGNWQARHFLPITSSFGNDPILPGTCVGLRLGWDGGRAGSVGSFGVSSLCQDHVLTQPLACLCFLAVPKEQSVSNTVSHSTLFKVMTSLKA